MPSLEWEVRPRIVIERRRYPALRIVAIRTGGLARLLKLPGMHIFVTILANLRSSLELHLRGSSGSFVTRGAFHSSMGSKQRKLRFRMVEPADVGPGPCIVARFAAQQRAVCALLCHAVLEFSVMGIAMARGTTHVGEMERQDFIRPARSAHFMTI